MIFVLACVGQFIRLEAEEGRVLTSHRGLREGDSLVVEFDGPQGFLVLSEPVSCHVNVALNCSDPESSDCVWYHSKEKGILAIGSMPGIAVVTAESAGMVRLAYGYSGPTGCGQIHAYSQYIFGSWVYGGVGYDCMIQVAMLGLVSIEATSALRAGQTVEGSENFTIFRWDSHESLPLIEPSSGVHALSFRATDPAHTVVPVSGQLDANPSHSFNFGTLPHTSYLPDPTIWVMSVPTPMLAGKWINPVSQFSDNLEVTPSPTASPKLSEGAIAGIAIGCWILLVIVGAVGLALREGKKNNRSPDESENQEEEPEICSMADEYSSEAMDLDEKQVLDLLNKPLASPWIFPSHPCTQLYETSDATVL
jgi:hypothetical protein